MWARAGRAHSRNHPVRRRSCETGCSWPGRYSGWSPLSSSRSSSFVLDGPTRRHLPFRANPRAEIPGELFYRGHDGCLIRAAASGSRYERLFCGIPYVPISGRAGNYAGIDAYVVVDRMALNCGHVTELDLQMKPKSASERRIRIPSPEDTEIWIFSKDGTVSGTLATGISRPVLSWRIDGIGVSPVVVE